MPQVVTSYSSAATVPTCAGDFRSSVGRHLAYGATSGSFAPPEAHHAYVAYALLRLTKRRYVSSSHGVASTAAFDARPISSTTGEEHLVPIGSPDLENETVAASLETQVLLGIELAAGTEPLNGRASYRHCPKTTTNGPR